MRRTFYAQDKPHAQAVSLPPIVKLDVGPVDHQLLEACRKILAADAPGDADAVLASLVR